MSPGGQGGAGPQGAVAAEGAASRVDLCVIGAGAAGLSIAAGAAQMGVETCLVQDGPMGGDCLNFGCVPSKALIAAARRAVRHREDPLFGLRTAPPEVDFAAVRDHVRGVIAAIAPQDSVERFEGLGVRVIGGRARFLSPRELAVAGRRIAAKRFVIASGSEPFVPTIEGLAGVPYLTNETVFELERLPEHLIIIGGGPIGCELGQAFRRLGAAVTLVEMDAILPRDDEELVRALGTRLRGEGLEIREGTRLAAVEAGAEGVIATLITPEGQERLAGSHLLVAAGRRAAVADLDLEAAGVALAGDGIKVDARLRTSNRRIFAAGDVTGGPRFTHMASHHAGVVIQNALLRVPAKVEQRAVPWVTYTDPELAQVGPTEAELREAGQSYNVLRWPFAENDRAQAERATCGQVKVLVTPRGKVLGASILGHRAGELIQPWILALTQGLKASALARMIAPYPTLGEAGKRAAGSFYAPKLFSPLTRRLVRLLGYLP